MISEVAEEVVEVAEVAAAAISKGVIRSSADVTPARPRQGAALTSLVIL